MSPSLTQAYLVKGFLLGKDAPRPILDAIDAIITGIPVQILTGSADLPLGLSETRPEEQAPEPDSGETRGTSPRHASQDERPHTATNQEQQAAEPKPRRKNNMSPEARAAAAERMRAMQARKRQERLNADDGQPAAAQQSVEPDEIPEFPEAELRITVPVPRRKSQLTDADWPEIKAMLARGRDRKLIASDYDEDPEDLDFFIASCQRREGKSPGEAPASPSGVTSDATTRRTW